MPKVDKTKDLAWNFANQIGLGSSEGFIEVVRLYNALHSALASLALAGLVARFANS
jgi:hypothetical protein